MKTIRSFILVGILITSFLSAGVCYAAATLSFSPENGNFTVGKTFTVKVMADGAGAAMNAAEGTITFDKTLLTVVSATKDGSIFSLWTTEPEFDNTKGTISFGGGNPKSFTAKSGLATITFKALKEGSAKVEFAAGSVLAADGKGTDILSERRAATFELSGKAAPEPKPEPEPEPVEGGIVPDAPDIKSTTHPDANSWYNKTTGIFSWENLPDVTATRIGLSSKPDSKPAVLYKPPVSEKTLDKLEEGIWYLSVQSMNESGWGKAGVRKIAIDLTPPATFTVSIAGEATSSTPTLRLGTTTDELSGLDRYEVIIGTEQSLPIKLTDITNGDFKLPPHPKGSYTLAVRAYDKAGNYSEASTAMLIEEDMLAKKVTEVEKPSLWERFGTMIIISLLLLIILFLIIMNFYQKNKLMREMRRGAKEAEEIKTKMEKIFSALKDEVEEQINALDKKPRLSESEKRAIGKIKEAIDISEELISKEIEDVEKILE